MFTQEFLIPADVGIGSWSRKNPPTSGWYNASIYRHEDILRFWDGDRWSTAFLALPRLGSPNPVAMDTKLNLQVRWRHLNPAVIARAWREASAS